MRYTIEQIRAMPDQTDWERLRREEREGIEPELDEEEIGIEWGEAVLMPPLIKEKISIRLDADILDFFKAQGEGYQTRINAVLRSYMEAVGKGSGKSR